MNYEVVTAKWRCEECGSPVRMYFEAVVDDEGGVEAYDCRRVLCNAGHQIQPEFVQLMMEEAQQELQAAFEGGWKTSEVWAVREEVQDSDASEGL